MNFEEEGQYSGDSGCQIFELNVESEAMTSL